MLQKSQYISTRVLTAIILVSGLAAIAYFGTSGDVSSIFLIAIFPFAALFFSVSVKNPLSVYYLMVLLLVFGVLLPEYSCGNQMLVLY